MALVVPPRCLICGVLCGARETVCGGCHRELTELPIGSRVARRGPWLRSHFAAYPMAGAARGLVHALKYRAAAAAAAEMARRIANRAPAGLFDGVLLVPVPAHPLHERDRGYNQSALLAKRLSRLTGAPVSDCLARSQAASPQTGLPRQQRLELDASSIAVAPGHTLTTRRRQSTKTNVLLLDDVTTTGVTLEICASAISRRTAAPVGAVTFAATGAWPGRTPFRSPTE